jgi:putative transposase
VSRPAVIIDSQSVKTSRVGGEFGFDRGKLVTGRKRHILVAPFALLLAVLVHRADTNDSQRAPHLLNRAPGEVPRLRAVFADERYAATPAGLICRVFGWRWSFVRRERPGS